MCSKIDLHTIVIIFRENMFFLFFLINSIIRYSTMAHLICDLTNLITRVKRDIFTKINDIFSYFCHFRYDCYD